MLKEVKLIWRCPYLHDRHEFGTMEAIQAFVEQHANMGSDRWTLNFKAIDRLRSKLLRVLRDPKGKFVVIDVTNDRHGFDLSLTIAISHRPFDYYMRTFQPGVEPAASSTKIKIPV